MNRGTNKRRIYKKTREKIKAGNEQAIKFVKRSYNKFNNGII